MVKNYHFRRHRCQKYVYSCKTTKEDNMSYQPKVRKIQLDFSDVGKYWFGGNPWVTYFSDSMNIL
ncbi:MAG: hypothetical protein D6767_02440, partial [Candidatus Hydrogenedentota bacterium]